MNRMDIIRKTNGADFALWRVEETYETDSPYVLGLLISNHKFHKAGTEKRMIAKAEYKVEPNPSKYAKEHLFTIDLSVSIDNAYWR